MGCFSEEKTSGTDKLDPVSPPGLIGAVLLIPELMLIRVARVGVHWAIQRGLPFGAARHKRCLALIRRGLGLAAALLHLPIREELSARFLGGGGADADAAALSLEGHAPVGGVKDGQTIAAASRLGPTQTLAAAFAVLLRRAALPADGLVEDFDEKVQPTHAVRLEHRLPPGLADGASRLELVADKLGNDEEMDGDDCGLDVGEGLWL